MWGYVAAAALPYVIGAFQKKPKRPAAPRPVVLPDRSAYVNKLLESGFNENSGAYTQASAQVADQVNRALAAQGLVGSSVGAQATIEGQNKVAQSFIDERLRRQQAAMQAVASIDQADAAIQQGNSQAAYQYAQDAYNAQLARQAAVQQGIGQMASAGANAYYANQATNTFDKRRAEDRAWMSSMYGGPGYAPVSVGAAPSVFNQPGAAPMGTYSPYGYGYGR